MNVKITKDFGEAGANQDNSHGLRPTSADALRAAARDLLALSTSINDGLNIAAAAPTAVAAGALGAFTDPPTAGEMASTRTLVNQLRTTAMENRTLAIAEKTALNGVTVAAIASADPAAITGAALAAFTDPPAAGEMAALRALVNEIRVTEIATRTLVIEIKTAVNAATAGTAPVPELQEG